MASDVDDAEWVNVDDGLRPLPPRPSASSTVKPSFYTEAPYDSPEREIPPQDGGSASVVGGILGGIILALLFLGLGTFVIIRKRRRKKEQKDIVRSKLNHTEDYSLRMADIVDRPDLQDTAQLYANTFDIWKFFSGLPTRVSSLKPIRAAPSPPRSKAPPVVPPKKVPPRHPTPTTSPEFTLKGELQIKKGPLIPLVGKPKEGPPVVLKSVPRIHPTPTACPEFTMKGDLQIKKSPLMLPVEKSKVAPPVAPKSVLLKYPTPTVCPEFTPKGNIQMKKAPFTPSVGNSKGVLPIAPKPVGVMNVQVHQNAASSTNTVNDTMPLSVKARRALIEQNLLAHKVK